MEAIETRLRLLERQQEDARRAARGWRGVALVALMVGLLFGRLPASYAADDSQQGGLPALAARVAALEALVGQQVSTITDLTAKLARVTVSADGSQIYITGANLHLRNGLGSTWSTNGLGNLIVGYNEAREDDANDRSGSHCVVTGAYQNYSSYGGTVIGVWNSIQAPWASITGGGGHTASGEGSSISGGLSNSATWDWASVSGGYANTADGWSTSVSGGQGNRASYAVSSVSGGALGWAEGWGCSISGGQGNRAGGAVASVSGGYANRCKEWGSSISGGYAGTVDGWCSSISGGQSNRAGYAVTSVSGGYNRSALDWGSWRAGNVSSGP